MMQSQAPRAPVIRDHAWVEREYNLEKYPRVLAAAREALAAGERDLSRLVGRICENERGAMVLSMHGETVIDGHAVQVPILFMAAGISGFITEALAKACSDETDAVIELGAGWGRNLFNLHLSGRIGTKTALHALEFAETARMAGALIANAASMPVFKASAYDYHNPDYGMIPCSDAPAVVATIHSVEQIPAITPDVFLKLIERRPNLSGVHLEPVSFQLPPERRGLHRSWTSPDYAETHDYNRNLWPVLAALETRGVIEIDEVVPDVLGLNKANASTLIFWRAKRHPR